MRPSLQKLGIILSNQAFSKIATIKKCCPKLIFLNEMASQLKSFSEIFSYDS